MIIEYDIEKKFEPVELKITIETEEELRGLWHRLNLSGMPDYYEYEHEDMTFLELWETLDDIADEYGIEFKVKEGC